jgi:hypothetical protein
MKAWLYVTIDQHSIKQSLSNNLKNESVYYNTAFKDFTCTGAVSTWDDLD